MHPLLIAALSFGAVAAIVLVAGQYYAAHAHLQRRLPIVSRGPDAHVGEPRHGIQAWVARYFQEKRFGLDGTFGERLRRDLLNAGYFSRDAVSYYLFARLVCIATIPAIVYATTTLFPTDAPGFIKVAIVLVAIVVAFLGPDAYLARRRRMLVRRFRLVFPSLMDLLVICVDAGLTLEAAFERVGAEIKHHSGELGMNLEMMGAEMRAGRSAVEALGSLAERLGLEEAKAFVSMIRQSMELGTDVGEALRVFSDEMREKRLLRAEEVANKLSVKMVLPLGLFIFPVVLLVVMLPVMIKLLTVLR